MSEIPVHKARVLHMSQQYNVLHYEEGFIMVFSIRLTEEEKALADSYASMHNVSLEEAFKKALFEKIEEEYDISIAEEAYNEYIEGGKNSRPIEELWEELDL